METVIVPEVADYVENETRRRSNVKTKKGKLYWTTLKFQLGSVL